VFRDGDVLQGRVVWFARYEFALHVAEEQEIVGFFHALLDWSVATAAEAQADDERKSKQRHDKHDHRHDHKHGRKGGRKGHR
jgi:sRNA-binding regulator protein Hfq